ncbi:Ribose-phosphate pyrophosphokinase [uncultured archaeon]|nr:Ribose-phosphate pyrophosphokinase [uncultured archaeon]
MKFIKPSWQKIDGMCGQLAEKVSGFKPDWLVGISRGGLVPVRLLSDHLDVPRVSVIRIEFYKTIGETRDFPTISQPLQVDVKGKRVLIVDDVADTGRSLAVAKEHIKRAGAGEVKIAVLHQKPKSMVKPDFCIATTDAWIIYPWEVQETKRELKNSLKDAIGK